MHTLLFTAKLCNSISVHIQIYFESFHRNMLVSSVHIVVFLRKFRTERNTALCVVNVGYSALCDTFSLFALDLFVYP